METLRILIVDDEPGMRLAMSMALTDFAVLLPEVSGEVRFDIDEVDNGEAALRKIATDDPQIILLDYRLPDMTGFDILERISTENSNAVAIMVTAYASLENAVIATKRGAFDFLAKPFTPKDLRSVIRRAATHVIMESRARELARERRRVRFQFISVLAHELKAPLNAIEGYLHIMSDHSAGDDPAVYENIVDRCLLRTEHMRKLIADLLDMTSIESGIKKRELAQVSLREVAQAAIETVAPEAAEMGVSVTLHADDYFLFIADRREMDIIFNNLVSNAVKYNRQGGSVDVCLAGNDEEIAIRVSDTGIGMTQDEIQRIFAEFVRIRNEKTKHVFGSGLGLVIVRKIAEMYGGEVRVTSKPDVGSTFTVTLSKQKKPPEELSLTGQTAGILSWGDGETSSPQTP